MEDYTRSDLACESSAVMAGSLSADIYAEERCGSFLITRLCVETDEQSEKFGKPRGHYTTVMCGKIWLMEETLREQLVMCLAKEIRFMAESLCGKEPDRNFKVLAAGLGNAEITPDAVGPRCVAGLHVTRHLRGINEALYDTVGRCEISALSPGVLGQTGIETAELIRGAAKTAAPDLVVAVDALAARSCERLGTTVQLSDSGLCPGSGIGNERRGITADTVGVPVLAIGVPTVVNSSVLVYDALAKAGIGEIEPALESVLTNGKSFFVSPKESDVITACVASLLSDAIDRAFLSEA